MSSFGKVKSSAKVLAFIGENAYIFFVKTDVNRPIPTLASNSDAWASMSCEEPSCNCQQNCQQTADLVKLGNDSPKLR
jgi:hypothetical protein